MSDVLLLAYNARRDFFDVMVFVDGELFASFITDDKADVTAIAQLLSGRITACACLDRGVDGLRESAAAMGVPFQASSRCYPSHYVVELRRRDVNGLE